MAKSTHQASITVAKDGPYLVSGKVPLAVQVIATDADGDSVGWREGTTTFEARDSYALCRCGRSNKKPFCDGTHTKIGFDGTETASREPFLKQAKFFEGPDLILADAESLCAFGRFCDPNGKVWNQVARTDEPAVRETFLRQVQNCPAGRLVAIDKATAAAVEENVPASIGLVEDPAEHCSGPLYLQGGIAVISADGFAYEVRNRATLCRCGESKNKPFCNGAHAAIKFHDGLKD
jgi:CDGSH-type Zn-finger protein